jgi:hypothetical protein
METYKVKIKKDIECREVQYKEGETWDVVRAVYNFLKHNNAIDNKKKQSKKEKKEETPLDTNNN